MPSPPTQVQCIPTYNNDSGKLTLLTSIFPEVNVSYPSLYILHLGKFNFAVRALLSLAITEINLETTVTQNSMCSSEQIRIAHSRDNNITSYIIRIKYKVQHYSSLLDLFMIYFMLIFCFNNRAISISTKG